jgi:hypothetical protein
MAAGGADGRPLGLDHQRMKGSSHRIEGELMHTVRTIPSEVRIYRPRRRDSMLRRLVGYGVLR